MRTLARPGNAHEIRRRLAAVTPENLPQWGRMSAHQMICHLGDGLRMMIGEKSVRQITGALTGTVARWIALRGPRRWPRGIRTTPELDQEIGGTRPVEFTSDLARALDLLERVTREPSAAHRRLHPIFGRMSEGAWLRWAYLHADHHLRQFGV